MTTQDVIEQSKWRQYIVSTPDVLSGKPRVAGTRIPVALILGYLALGRTHEQIIAEYPDLTVEQILACLEYASELVEYKVV